MVRCGTEGTLRHDELLVVETDRAGRETRTLRSRSKGSGGEPVLQWHRARVLAQQFGITPSMVSVSEAREAFEQSLWLCRAASPGQERRLQAALLAHLDAPARGSPGDRQGRALRLGSFNFGRRHRSSRLSRLAAGQGGSPGRSQSVGSMVRRQGEKGQEGARVPEPNLRLEGID